MTLLDGFLLNIELFAVTLVLSLPLGLVVSFGTMSRFKPLSLLVRLYVYIMRSTPRPTSPRSSAAASRVSPPASGRPGRCWA